MDIKNELKGVKNFEKGRLPQLKNRQKRLLENNDVVNFVVDSYATAAPFYAWSAVKSAANDGEQPQQVCVASWPAVSETGLEYADFAE